VPRHVDHEAVADVVLGEALEGGVDLGGGDDLVGAELADGVLPATSSATRRLSGRGVSRLPTSMRRWRVCQPVARMWGTVIVDAYGDGERVEGAKALEEICSPTTTC
jgi:hypothetical protein